MFLANTYRKDKEYYSIFTTTNYLYLKTIFFFVWLEEHANLDHPTVLLDSFKNIKYRKRDIVNKK